MRDPWRTPRAIATVVALPIATAVCIFAVYGEWDLLSYGDLFWRTIQRFPWVRISLLLTLITCLAGVAGAHRRTGGTILGSSMMYAVVIVPFVLLILYPGTAALGRFSDPAFYYLILLLDVVHGIGFYHIRRAVEDAERGTIDGSA